MPATIATDRSILPADLGKRGRFSAASRVPMVRVRCWSARANSSTCPASPPTCSALVEVGDFSGAGGGLAGRLRSRNRCAAEPPSTCNSVKAAGVTFAVSAIERVIEERARGDYKAAAAIRERLESRIGGSIRTVVPGTAEAAALKAALIEDGLWSQYLEVAIGPDAEVFTKSPVLSTVGAGADIGRALGQQLEQSRARDRAARGQPGQDRRCDARQ